MEDNVLEEAHYNGGVAVQHFLDPLGGFDSNYHMHPYYELNFIVSCGRVNVINHDNHFEITEPCVVIHTPMSVHGLAAESGVPYERYLLDIDPEIAKQLGAEFFPIEQLASTSMNAIFLRGDLREFCLEHLHKIADPNAAYPRRVLLSALLIERLSREIFADRNVMHSVKTKDAYINDVLRFLYTHFRENLQTANIAEAFFVSRAKLNRDFEHATSTSIKQYVLRLRISHAKFLLRRGVDCAEVAQGCGFGNAQYFNRAFRRIEGITPGQYARRHLQDAPYPT